MEELIKKLILSNGYNSLSIDSTKVSAFQSERFRDAIIVAPYTFDELKIFNSDQCTITKEVLSAFDSMCETNPDTFKDTCLIVCYKIKDSDEYQKAANVILDIEENEYGLRKFIVTYTDQSIAGLKNLDGQSAVSELHQKLKDGFEQFISTTPESLPNEYDVISQLFIKLPFMKVQSSRASNSLASLSEVVDIALKEHVNVLSLCKESGGISGIDIEDSEELPDLDAQIDILLSSESVKQILKDEEL